MLSATEFYDQVTTRLAALMEPGPQAEIDRAVQILVEGLDAGGVLHAFGTGHSEAFAMEIAGRAGGLIPTTKTSLRDLVIFLGYDAEGLTESDLERRPGIAAELFELARPNPADVFLIASNSGVNNSIIDMALVAKEHGHKLIAVTSLEHTQAVNPKHASGKRLADIADVVIDNRAPYGDATLDAGNGVKVGAVSSITAAFIAQLLTLGVVRTFTERGDVAPTYISANIPEGDAHNRALEEKYAGRLRRSKNPA